MTKRCLGLTVALVVMFLAFALPGEALVWGQPSERPAPVRGSREYAAEKGPQLLTEERWSEAAEVYSFWDHDLNQAVRLAHQRPPSKGEVEQDGYRFRLLNFYFAQVDFSRLGWSSSAATLAECAEKYRDLIQRTHPPAGATVLDFSHLDLLKDTAKRARQSNGLTAQDKAGMLTALNANPESILLRSPSSFTSKSAVTRTRLPGVRRKTP